MVQILNRMSPSAQLGASFGTGLGGLLEGLATGKAKQMQKQQFEQAGLPGILADLEPQVQAAYLREYGAAQQQAAQQQEAATSQDLLNKLLYGQAPQFPSQLEPQVPQMREEVTEKVEMTPEELKFREQFSTIPTKEKSPVAQSVEQIKSLEDALINPNIPFAQKERIQAELSKRQERFERQQEKVDKVSQEYYAKTNNEAAAALSGNNRLDEMEKLARSGKLTHPLFGTFLETLENGIPLLGVSIDLFGLTNPESQKFKKLQAEFLKDMKTVFGARITNEDIKQFLKGIPRLSQTNTGKVEVIKRLRSLNDAASTKKEIMDEVIAENYGHRPRNFQSIVEKRYSDDLDRIAREFKGESPEPEVEEASLIQSLGYPLEEALEGSAFQKGLQKTGGAIGRLGSTLGLL